MSPDPDTLARTLAFERELVASVSTRLVPFAWGTAYLNDGYRERWDSNFLWVDGTGGTVPMPARSPRRPSACSGTPGSRIARSGSTTTRTAGPSRPTWRVPDTAGTGWW